MNGGKFLIAVGVGLLVLGAALIYVSESRHLDDPEPEFANNYSEPMLVGGQIKQIGIPNPKWGEPSANEREEREIALVYGIASLVLGSALLVGGWLMPRKSS